ncbi:MAG: cell division protein FtsQ/DivIB [Acidobacteriota bacterium]|nr:cell division protein FtsQ/DivIB [Acidobacteriota bacterium]
MSSGSWARERRLTIPRLLPRRLRSLHTLALVLVAVLVGWLGWTWYRGSSFVKVQRVTVTGLSGPDVPQIRDALRGAALQMTTLDMNIARLESAVSQYGYVQRLTVAAQGAHAVVIHVAEQVPVAIVQVGGRDQVVDADGQLLSGSTTHGALPVVPLASTPDGTSITAPGARAAIATLAAAPYALLAHVQSATSSSAHGVLVQLRNGPVIYFGPDTQLTPKWTAAVAVLQSTDSAGASYIDVTDPARPAAGAGVSQTQASALGLASAGSTTTTG